MRKKGPASTHYRDLHHASTCYFRQSYSQHSLKVTRHRQRLYPCLGIGGAHLVNVNDPPAGVLAVGDDAEVDEVVGGVAVLPERVHSLDPAEPGLVPAAPIRDQYSGHQPITNTHPLDQSEASIAAS